MSASVCLVTSGHLTTNPRLIKEADALVGENFQVSIVAARFLPWADLADKEFANRPWIVKTVEFGSLANPVLRAYRSLRRRFARRFVKIFGFRLAWVERASHWITPELTRTACATPAELYIAHNLAALPAAVTAARQNGAKVIFDAEDFHSGEVPDDAAWDFERSLVTVLEKHYLPQCDALTAASPGIARAYAQKYRLPQPSVVLNVFPRDQGAMKANDAGTVRPGPSIYWFSQTIGANRGLEVAVRAIGLSRSKPHLYLRGNVSPAYRDELERAATSAGVNGKVHFLPPAAPADMATLASGYDLGLASEPGHTENNRLAWSNKIFTYFLAGLPSVASATPAQLELAEWVPAAMALFPPDDAVALSIVLDNLLLDPARLANVRHAAFSLGQTRFNWEFERQAWVALINTLLSLEQRAGAT